MRGMERTLPATHWRLPPLHMRDLGILSMIAGASLLLLVLFQRDTGVGGDWHRWFEALPAQVASGNLYEPGYNWRWSPVAAWAFVAIILPAGLLVWSLAHVAAVALLAKVHPMLMWATLLAWPFWVDLIAGNTFTFVAVAAIFAVRGSRIGAIAFLALTLLMPRPVQIPLMLWLLWRRPDVRAPFVLMFVGHALVVLGSGYALDWAGKLVSSTDEMELGANLAPSRVIGWLWPVIGLPLAAGATLKGRLGLASLCASPYWLPQYLLMGVLEWTDSRRL